MADLRTFDVEKLASLSDDELKAICANPHIDVGQQMLAAEELTSRAIRQASKPHWSVRATFYLVSLSVIILLLQLWWTARTQPPLTSSTAVPATVIAKPAKASAAKSNPRKSKRARRKPRPADQPNP